ncbi:Serine carboxypeptidase-like 42 isoform 1 [Hibiscus syriacus]|uniref:Serine carboxypeptidase-like 42 isoform 1 n=1 Tax=Hibiscus syriacus TaxID=106335 RepID=A0A6A3BFW7_HIBSY|nr:Serine carboxypeptidase-like 42 isoform 1 [Hibiscus syriacus]
MRLKFLSRTLPTSEPSSFLQHSYFSTILPLSTRSGSSTPERYSHLVRLCLQQCREVKTRYLFDEMSQTREPDLKARKMIHAQGLKLGFCSKGLFGNAILDLWGDVVSAEKAFHSLEKRDVFAWNSVISMYSKRGLVEEVFKSIGPLMSSGVLPNEFTFATLLSACAKLKDVEFGRLVHCFVVKMDLEASPFCEGALIDIYSKCNYVTDARKVFGSMDLDTISWTSMVACYVQVGLPEDNQVAFVSTMNAFVGLGRLDDARALFSQMPNPNVVAWNVMISGHAKRGYEVEAIEFFHNMRGSGVKSTRSTLGSVLSVIASLAALDLGLLVHGEAIKQGLNSNVYVGSSLINMYPMCEEIDAAKKVFDELHEKNVVLWNAMLGGCAQNDCADEVIEMFSQMKGSDYHPDEFTYTSTLSACASLGCLETGRQFHGLIIKNKFASNLFVANALVDMYSKSGALKEARQQFEIIKDRDNVSWNAIIVGYVQGENEFEAFNMFRRMILDGIVPDEVSLASILSGCTNVQNLEHGKQVHCLAIKSGLDKSLYAGSDPIDMYAKSGTIWDAHKVLYVMSRWSVVSMNAMIVALSSLQEGRQINALIYKTGYVSDELTTSALVDMCAKCGDVKCSAQVFYEMNSKNGISCWNSMIVWFAKNGYAEDALRIFFEMTQTHVMLDDVAFLGVLTACSHAGKVSEGRQIFDTMVNFGIQPRVDHCACIVDLLGRWGFLKKPRISSTV